jgi:MFS family permease
LIWQAANMAAGIVSNSWIKELLPEESRGRFLGVRMIFLVLLPMLIGPRIGSSIIQIYGVRRSWTVNQAFCRLL